MDKNKTTYKLIELLADGRFHSGEVLGKTLGITRSGIWKAIQQIEQLGLEIHAVTGKGYRLAQRIELLNADLIMQQLHNDTKNKIDCLTLLTTVGSTNEYLLKAAKTEPHKTIACLAEYQSAGRGRCGKSWFASFGSSINFSLLWHFSKDPSEMLGLSLAAGIAVVNALKKYGVDQGIQLKWPNDILWQNRKLAGILIDMIAESHGKCSCVIGIGINLQMPFYLGQQIQQAWVDLAQITHSENPKRNYFASLVINEVISMIDNFNQHGLSFFLDYWRASDPMIGKNVTITTPKHKIHGVMKGISPKGELMLLTENNEVQSFLSGEVSLRLTEQSA